ncbi:MAG: CPBP family intramembrane glutamic endopeptidase [Candidatus Hodarchaeota archaeon]
MKDKNQKSFYSLAKFAAHEILMEGQIASAGAHQARLLEKFKRNKNYIRNQFLALKLVFGFLFVFFPFLPLATYFEIERSIGSYAANSIAFISSFMFGIYFGITFLYMIMFGMVSTSSFMSGNSFKWLQTLPFSKKDIRKIGLMTLFRNLDIPLIISIAAFPIIMFIGTQNFFIFITSLLVSILNVVFNFSLLVIIGEKLSFLFSESKGKSKRVNLIRIITMLGYFTIAFGSGLIFSFGFRAVDRFVIMFKTSEPPIILNIILSIIPFALAPAYLLVLTTIPNQIPIELFISTLIGFALFMLVVWVLFIFAQRALRTTISTEIIDNKVKKKDIPIEIKTTSTIKAYIRKDLVSTTRDLQSFMFIFFPIFYPLVLVFTLQGPIINEVTTIEGILILWSAVVGIYLFIPPMLIVGFLNLEESGASIKASLPLIPRDQAKAKIVLMLSIQGISLTFITLILTLLTSSILVVVLFVVTLPIAWSMMLVMFELKIHFFGKMKYKYILEELHKEHKVSKWILMILIEFGIYFAILTGGVLLILIFNIYVTMLTFMIVGLTGLSILIFAFTRMFPKVEKIAEFKTGGFLREHVNAGTSALLALYFIWFFIPIPVIFLISLVITNFPFLVQLFLIFFLDFGFFALLWLVTVPLGLKLPNKESFKDFSRTIGLSRFKPLTRNLLLACGSLLILIFSNAIFASLFGTWVVDPEPVFNNPSIYSGLGWFVFIYMLIPGIWEEISFRGVILNLQLKKYSQVNAVIINGILFGLFHYINLLGNPDLYLISMQVIYASCLGIAFGYMYVKTKSLIPCMVTHYLIDAVGQLFLRGLFSNIGSLTIYFIFGIGIVPMILIIILTKLLISNKHHELANME